MPVSSSLMNNYAFGLKTTPGFAGVGEVVVIMRRRIPAAVERRVMGERKKAARKGRKGRNVRRGRGTMEGRWTQ